VVIPKRWRQRLGLEPGSEVSFEDREDGVLVRPQPRPSDLEGRYAGSDMAARLLEDRRREPR